MEPKPVEASDREELRELQSERLRETVAHAYENVPFYREKLDEMGLSPDDIDGVEDITELPMTTKEDFRDEYPDGLFAVDDEDVARIHASSGTTGKPKIVSYTDDDLDVWSEVVARSLAASGAEEGGTVQNAYGYGLFTGGLGLHYGVEELDATVIPVGSGQTQRQVELMTDLESDVFEPCTDPMREEIEERLDVDGIDIYGLSEIIGPGVSCECHEAQNGLHIWEDHFYPEVVDPRTGEPVEEGEEGELILTTLTKEALPVMRYRTGDLTTLNYEECACGRTMVRMDNVTGRADDLLIVRGVNLYPSEIEHVVLDIDGVAPHYRIDLDKENNLDVMELTIECEEDLDRSKQSLEEEITERLSNVLQFTPDELNLVDHGEIGRSEVGKVQRVYDHRN